MKNNPRILALFLVLAQVFCLFSAVAGAEYGAETNVRVGGVMLQDEVYYMVQDGALVAFDPSPDYQPDRYIRFVSGYEPTVTMKNFSYTVNGESDDPTFSALYIPMDVVLYLEGENELINNGVYVADVFGDQSFMQNFSNGVNATENCNIRLRGSGILRVKTRTDEGFNGYAFIANRVSFESTDLTVEAAGATAAFSSAPLHDDGLRLDIQAGENEYSNWGVSAEDGASFTQNRYVKAEASQAGPTPEEIAAQEAERIRLEQEAEAERIRLEQEELQRQQEEELRRQQEEELQRQQEEELRRQQEEAERQSLDGSTLAVAPATGESANEAEKILIAGMPIESGVYYQVIDGTLQRVEQQPESGYLILNDDVLSLNNFNYLAREVSNDDRYAGLYLPHAMTISVTGNNDLTNIGYYMTEDSRCISNGISAADDADITITGQGALTVNAVNSEGFYGYGFAAGNVSVGNGVLLTVRGAEGQSTGEITYEPAPQYGPTEEELAAQKAAEEAEAAKKAADEEAAKKTADEEAAKKAADEEAAKKAAEEEAAKKAAEEEAAKKAADEEAAKKAAEEEAAKKAAEEEAAQKAAEEAAKKAAEEAEAAQKAAEAAAAQKKAEEDAAALKRQQEEAAAQEEAARLAAAESAKKAEAEAAKKAADEEAAEKARIAEEAAKEEQKPELATVMTADMQKATDEVNKEDLTLDTSLAENFTMKKESSEITVQPGILTLEKPPVPGGPKKPEKPADPDKEKTTFAAADDSSGFLYTTEHNLKYQVGIKKDGKYYGTDEWTDLPESTQIAVDQLDENSVIQVKRVEGDQSSNGLLFVLERQPQLSVTTSPATSAGNDGKIILPADTGTVQIKIAGSDQPYGDAIVNSSNEITGLTGGTTYQLRVKGDGIKLASQPIDVKIGSYVAPTKLDPPTATFTATGEQSGILKNVDSSMVYKIGSAGTPVQITGDSATIASGVSGQIFVKRVGNIAANTVDSDWQIITIQQYSTPEKEHVTVSNGSVTIQYKDVQAQYKAHSASSEASYQDVVNRTIQNLLQGDYDIRFKQNGEILASKPLTITIANVPVTSISMDPREVKLSSTDSSAKLTVTFNPLNASDQTVSWYSSNENVVKIQNSYKISEGVAGASVVAVGQGTATIYALSNGKQATCTVTVQTNYYFTYHKNGTWYYDVSGNYTVQATGPASRLAAVKINGQTLNPYYYTVATASDGSTIVTISETAMRAMEHRAYQTLQFVYSDGGTATCYLHILSVRDKPITGDDSNIGLWLSLLVMSSAMGGTLLTRRKEWE